VPHIPVLAENIDALCQTSPRSTFRSRETLNLLLLMMLGEINMNMPNDLAQRGPCGLKAHGRAGRVALQRSESITL